jgi:MerR family redox-sensitive transcriptional activator SoxR
LSIGEVAERVGLNASALRYYERAGLLPPAERVGGKRRYGPDAVDLLLLIRFCQDVGFSLAEVGTLLTPPTKEKTKERWRQLVDSKVTELDALIERAEAIKQVLAESRECDCVTLSDCSLVQDAGAALAHLGMDPPTGRPAPPDGSTSPAVSVCIRASARPADLLTEAIDSVLAQTFTDFEIVISDDSACRGPVVPALDDPRVRYHANPRPAGSVANMRRVLGLARAPLVCLLDDDDLWLPEFLATTVERFQRDPDVGVVFTDHYLDVGGQRVARRPPIAAGRHDDFLPQLLEHWGVTLCSSLIRREVWQGCQRDFPLVDGTIGDITLWVAAALADWPFHYVDRPLAVWRQHAAQMTWSDELPARNVATLERFRFSDPASEQLRRARLAEARAAQAGVHLRHGRFRAALVELGDARRTAPERIGVRGLMAFTGIRHAVMRFAASHPRLLTMGAPVWRRVRPPVVRRGG